MTATPRRVPLAESKILRAYAEKTPGSARLYARARKVFPDGVTHVGRFLEPHPVYIARAAGSRKWDVDGNESVDYFGGHGSLILGHNHPAVAEAVTAQIARGTHYGASHELEVEWAELVQEMIPSAERVRFTSSGTEATLLALRLARAATGKSTIVRFAGHFHGWHDHAAWSADAPPGIVKEIGDRIELIAPHDLGKLGELCASSDDIAAVILEPTGATFGQVPFPPRLFPELREITRRHGVVLIFDEVMSGFRCSPGGVQKHYGVTPDMTTLAKIIAGGYPGAAVVGRAEILAPLDYRRGPDGVRSPSIMHQGTFNANPVSAAAGVATLRLLRDGALIERANAAAAAIRDGLSEVLRRRGVNWCAYGEFSSFQVFCNQSKEPVTTADIYAGKVPWTRLKGAIPMPLIQKLRTGLLIHGVDISPWPGGFVSAMHDAVDVDRTVTAFERVLEMLAEEGELG